MDTEQPGARREYPALPLSGKAANDPARPSVSVRRTADAPTFEVDQQLQDLIFELRSLTREMRTLREERRHQASAEPARAAAVAEPLTESSAVAKQGILSGMAIAGRSRRRRSSSFKGVWFALVIAGVAAAIVAAMVLFFHGPAIL